MKQRVEDVIDHIGISAELGNAVPQEVVDVAERPQTIASTGVVVIQFDDARLLRDGACHAGRVSADVRASRK